MSTDFVGEAYIEIDGKEYDVVSIKVTETTGRKVVKTMNRKHRAKGTCAGIKLWSLSITAAMPMGEPVPWADFKDAKFSVIADDGSRESYIDCFSEEIGKQYEVENEARVDISMIALDHIKE